jgi:hypothetical protein
VADPLTRDGIKRLIVQLGADLDQVEASDADDQDKHNVRRLVGAMRNQLRAALLDSDDTWINWVQDMGPMFQDLSTQLQAILDMPPPGACQYSGGCIQTTAAHCDNLSGTFFPGAPC